MIETPHQAAINQLAALFRSNQPTRPVLLLGAGASFSSGVPTAAELVQQVARLGCAIEKFGDERRIVHITPTDSRIYAQTQDWWNPQQVADCFPYAVEAVLRPPERRRTWLAKWIKHQRISDGYAALARLMARKLCWTILTTNFDSVLIESLASHKMQLREIIEVNRTRDDLARFRSHNRCQIVYLHGAIDYYTDCNLVHETQILSDKLAEKLWPMLSEAPLIVIGYRGSELSVMQHLLGKGIEKCDRFRHGIFWCHRKGVLHPSVIALQAQLGSSFKALEIEGFDELFVGLDLALTGDSVSQDRFTEVDVPVSWDSRPADGLSMTDINEDELRSTLLNYWRELGINPPPSGEFETSLIELQLAVRKDQKLIPTNACVLLFGRNPNDHFPHAAVSLRVKKKRQSIFSGNLVRQFGDISAALNDANVNPVVRVKSETGSFEKQAYPPLALRELIVNLLVHRDYGVQDISTIEHSPGISLEFRNPGGLAPSIMRRLTLGPEGAFTPIRGHSECRNTVIADIFCGLAQMDKAGSGLPDVELEMPKHGGRAEFYSET
ncbi:MAG TPA: SIR2 family protein, partial [Verrucomicrobiae bacterium]|nr:SIR2 family protein [Verrucomicrobiae bacterium]